MFRIKKLDQLVLKAFLGRFLVTFFIVLFVLLMQFFWLYMDDLLGKGIGSFLIMKLLFFMSATLVPLALPLAILLSSIMTFGSFGESFELVAVKASGISLFRFMRPLTILICAMGIGAFLFNNYTIPEANLRAYSLLHDISHKPIMNLKPGVFSQPIGDYIIRIGYKAKDGESIGNVLIYDQGNGRSGTTVIAATSGKMYTSPDKKYLIFELKDGWRYENKRDAKGNWQQTRMHFDSWTRDIDISSFSFSKSDQGLFKSNQQMMRLGQLQQNIDSMQRNRNRELKQMQKNITNYTHYNSNGFMDSMIKLSGNRPVIQYKQSFAELIPDSLKSLKISNAMSTLQNAERISYVTFNTIDAQRQQDARLKNEWHRKIALSFACLLLFLIGAPLGGIIRKGGLGVPVLVAIIMFVIYYIISTTGEKLSKQLEVSPWFGMWVATLILLPAAIFILIKARNDSAIFNKDFYFRIRDFLVKLFRKHKAAE